MTKAKIIAGLAVVAILIIVFLQNDQPVAFTFLFFRPVLVSKTLLIASSALLGSVATLLIQFLWRRRGRTIPASPPSTPVTTTPS